MAVVGRNSRYVGSFLKDSEKGNRACKEMDVSTEESNANEAAGWTGVQRCRGGASSSNGCNCIVEDTIVDFERLFVFLYPLWSTVAIRLHQSVLSTAPKEMVLLCGSDHPKDPTEENGPAAYCCIPLLHV